jgi:hypothetical protein
MRWIKKSIVFLVSVMAMIGCASSANRKSSDYYFENKVAIEQILLEYEELYAVKPFSAGFSDKSFQYYLMEVQSDSVRYIYNTEKNIDHLKSTIAKYNYDTAKLSLLAKKLKAIECLWLSKSSFYINETRETVTFLSFRSVSSRKAFVENKYYILIFTPHEIENEQIKARIKKGELIKIADQVYFTIGSNFR